MTAIVAIVGRPNVGKSTLYNRLSRSKNALVDNKPGITRDRLYARVFWNSRDLTIVDTGGFDELGNEPLLEQVRDQVMTAIEEADKILFMVDGRQGLTPGDEEIADLLRRSRKGIYVAVNKIDGPEHENLAHDFYRLGMDRVYPLSAAHGYGLRGFMDDVVRDLPDHDAHLAADDRVRVAVIGRPNVGKSSLINRILGTERLLVNELPGTTRDSIDTPFQWEGKEYLLIDTAGIRRKSRVKEKIDKFSMIKALKSLDRCHLAVILLDASTGVAEQDARICGYALERGRGLILVVNKWDLVKKDQDQRKMLNLSFERQLKFCAYAPRLNISALTGERVSKLFNRIDSLYEQFSKRISTGRVNRVLEDIIREKPPPITSKGRLKFFYVAQTATRPPTFVVFVNRPDLVHFSYQRFLTNQFRERFELQSTPIKLILRKKSKQ